MISDIDNSLAQSFCLNKNILSCYKRGTSLHIYCTLVNSFDDVLAVLRTLWRSGWNQKRIL